MTVYDLLYLCTDDGTTIAIWDLLGEKRVFTGSIRDAMYSEYADYEVMSYDLMHIMDRFDDPMMEINIEIEEDEDA